MRVRDKRGSLERERLKVNWPVVPQQSAFSIERERGWPLHKRGRDSKGPRNDISMVRSQNNSNYPRCTKKNTKLNTTDSTGAAAAAKSFSSFSPLFALYPRSHSRYTPSISPAKSFYMCLFFYISHIRQSDSLSSTSYLLFLRFKSWNYLKFSELIKKHLRESLWCDGE